MRASSDVVARCFAAFGARDPDAFLKLVHDDVTWQPASTLLAGEPGARPYEGRAGILDWFRDVADLEGYRVQTLGFHESGDRVLVPAVATLATDITWLTRAVYFVFTVRDGRVAALRSFEREDEARREAGVPPVVAAIADDAVDPGSLQVRADPAELASVRSTLREAAVRAGMDPAAANDLLVAVTEAMTNAITHGRPDEEGRIGLHWGREGDMLAVCVDDRGRFTSYDARDQGREDHGRGIAVMSLLVDDLAIEAREDRTLVRLAKRLQAG